MDVELETSVGKIFIEVKVTADCSGEKVSYIKSNKVPTLEIDLSQFLEQPPGICQSNALLQMGQTSNSGSNSMNSDTHSKKLKLISRPRSI
ncbi:hypothetical protein [Pseudoalteromonas aurantia]|uniref:Uncharacterized protein n=2 Tax=Pseudoalteromonas aurantia TaxID=43654 RepID=A0A5S3V486_9GAMM|nr:hypothetical protein [Pseudoalteromonas aurantia]TMO65837.1 hypothetical protein CWC19_17125 [Pseudoalteromonas aurantia]